nr:endolytic transglycosylase MltG [bacterium]
DVWNSMGARSGDAKKLSDGELLALASVVEKETGDGGERPLVASVFFNRLRTGMPLQSDPTIIYGLKDYDGNIRRSDISNPHPYNTYVHAGLPPGPICNPGRASISAVFNPAQSDYLYFVSRKDGTHEFSRTLSEHNRAVGRYQLSN